MRRTLLAMLCLAFLIKKARAHTDDFKEYLRDHYRIKTFVVRDFLSGSLLSYDSSGLPTSHAPAGDWTESGFVTIDDAQIRHNHPGLRADLMVVVSLNQKFQLLPYPHPEGKRGVPVFVQIDIQLGGTASPQAVDALQSKVFLSTQDSRVDLVPA